MRGKPVTSALIAIAVRITPADAGKTVKVGRPEVRDKDHPRGCGENPVGKPPASALKGSPPRMRGKPFLTDVDIADSRITPADAGKTTFFRHIKRYTGDHPRGCGENGKRNSSTFSAMGSPPRMRGKHGGSPYSPACNGITPADAGKTSQQYHSLIPTKDHPRGCGENFAIHYSQHSPHRITPADAGKTQPHYGNCNGRQDHPRGCGENGNRYELVRVKEGSPPRMRGKLAAGQIIGGAVRITPADAGKTLPILLLCGCPKDHPRGCGENPASPSSWACPLGSPPRMRGKPLPIFPRRR